MQRKSFDYFASSPENPTIESDGMVTRLIARPQRTFTTALSLALIFLCSASMAFLACFPSAANLLRPWLGETLLSGVDRLGVAVLSFVTALVGLEEWWRQRRIVTITIRLGIIECTIPHFFTHTSRTHRIPGSSIVASEADSDGHVRVLIRNKNAEIVCNLLDERTTETLGEGVVCAIIGAVNAELERVMPLDSNSRAGSP
jgi:hypothetical protein